MKLIYTAFLLSIGFYSFAQQVPIPKNHQIVESKEGDLDKDGVKELVVAYNTKVDGNESVPRKLVIYKKKAKQWIVWKQSNTALYGSKDGGMMGDPFGAIEIKNGILEISQNGGSSWKWGFTDKYRFQNGDFYLIGYSSMNGKPCEYWENTDFNLSTGKLVISKEFESCETEDQKIYKTENESFFKKDVKITLQSRNSADIKITSPKYKHQIYLTIKL